MIKSTHFGTTSDGREIRLYHLTNGKYSVDISNYGATLIKFCGPDRYGKTTDILLGFDTADTYLGACGYMGSVVGRFCNRIENGSFTLNGKTYNLFINNGKNHLHGGQEGFNHKLFTVHDIDKYSIEFDYLSPDGEENYPGNLDVQVTYSLSAKGELTVDYYTISDADTIINLTNHAYFNLNGTETESTVLNHTLQISASAYCETDEECLANGNIIAVRNTPFDFRKERIISEVIESDFKPVKTAHGIDHNFVLDNKGFREFARLYSDKTGIELICSTDQPGVQIYTGNAIKPTTGKYGTKYSAHSGICIETQGFPNAAEFGHFPSPFIKKGEIYRRSTVYKFSTRD